MNLTRAQKVRLGTFVIVGASLMIGGIAVLAGLQILERRDVYTVRFKESVGGLEVGAPVKYNGLRVGRVDTMRIDAKDPSVVVVELSLEKETPIYHGTTAVQTTSGLTGIKNIELQGGEPSRGHIEVGGEIPQGASFVERITGQAQEIATKVEMVVNQLIGWTDDKSRQRIEHFIEGIDIFSRESAQFLHTNREPMADALRGVAAASVVVTALSDDAQETVRLFNTEMVKTMETLRQPFSKVQGHELAEAIVGTRDAMQNLSRRLSDAETGKIIGELDDTMQQVQRVLQDLELSVRAGREDFVTTLSYLRQAAEDIREFSRTIAQDPSVLVRGKEIRE